MSKRVDKNAGDIQPTPLADALSRRYLNYALSTIMSRSLPDVRDGMKPVHRRLLFSMRQMRLDPDQGYKKSARVVGDVIGRFHPHGDQAVYDTLVRLAQDFSVRFPLVDGQGNFGSIDGDNAAAFRYTEARMTAVAMALLDGIDDDAVDFRPTYDGEDEEPTVLPANFPNLLANGASGIAVGMATNIPPHNAGEICVALAHLLKTPNASIEKLVSLMPGPDLPTGGILTESRESVVEAYRTGRGSMRIRARWEVEQLPRGQYQITVTEIPYQVQKSRLVERIAELLLAKKLVLLGDVRDESAEDIRLVLEPRNRNVEPEILMESLFKLTDLETRIGLNMNVLDADQTPRVMSLREVLQAFIDHRHVVLERRATFRLGKIADRLEILGGYKIVYLHLDEVIRIVREEDEPKAVLMSTWDLTENQADAILNMRLRSLRRLEEIAITKEIDGLEAEQKDLKGLLKSDKRRDEALAAEFKEIRAKFGEKTDLGRRRTEIADAPVEIDVPLEATIEREPVTVVCSDKGWVRSLRGHGLETADLKYKEGDKPRFFIEMETTDKLLVFATNGRFYTIGADRLPGGRGHGEPLKLMLDMGNDVEILTLMVHAAGAVILVASDDGRGFLISQDDLVAQTRGGRQILNVKGDVEALRAVPAVGDHIAVIGENRKMLIFPVAELPTMGRGRGVRLQNYAQGGLADVRIFTLKEGLTVKTGGKYRTFSADDLKDWIGKRAQAGRLPPVGFPRTSRFGDLD